MIPNVTMPAAWWPQPYRGPPVFFGHYWFTGTPRIITTQIACLDYSAARAECPLVAYRWDGEAELCNTRLIWT